jgi:ectoine hydroxylase-related dioxygenase (phytanoyl-CoA dioxygenase family)
LGLKLSQFVESFVSLGYAGPLAVFTTEQCQQILAHEQDVARPKPLNWWKGRAATDPFYARLASDEHILNLLRRVLGNDIVLWGVDVLHRRPNAVHPWHCDIESCAPGGGFASIWIGLNNTSQDSSLNFVTRTHKLGRTIQEEASHRGLKRQDISREDVVDWAQRLDPDAQLIVPDMKDGDALLTDGRLWHGTHNTRSSGIRTALLLQYAAADRPVRIFDVKSLEWPFRFLSDPLPPLLVVSGSGDKTVNRLLAFPEAVPAV